MSYSGMALLQNEGLISVSTGALLLRATLSRRAELPGCVRWAVSLRCRVSGQQDVGHEGVITGRDAFSLRSSISLIPKESPSLHFNQPLHLACPLPCTQIYRDKKNFS